ncbi:hypothetical protein [Azoarcus sp. DN11]|uniref:hypothetical protein n=1 Tax=Azoarcus sp. DN11 TaxID=356837 RepID=UPI000EABAC7B|nr:hypothetical protein [Azoarcus sp. DN11]AYH43957.1 hypothetical protein CDA09_11245 [Azoarcus sp. DN11]
MPDVAKVRVVDDDPVTRTCLAEHFAAESYEVLVTGTAEKAGRLAVIEAVDLGQRLREVPSGQLLPVARPA